VAISDDGAMIHLGGTIQLMKEHPSIRLLAEHVHARIFEDYSLVECIFFLRNEGPSTAVEIGFPNYGDSDGPDSIPRPYEYFESYVDGKKVDVKLVEAKGSPSWYCKSVRFNENELKVVRDVYKGRNGSDTWGDEWFNYVLYTGGSWLGPIGAANIVITFEGANRDKVFRIAPPGYEIDNEEVRWTFTNFEPRNREDDISVRWDGNEISKIRSDIHRLAALGDIEGVRKLLEQGVDVNSQRGVGITPISDAIYFGAGPEMVEFLLKNGALADFDPKRDIWVAPLSVAVKTYERFNTPHVLEAAQLLIEHGAKVGPEFRNFIHTSDGDLKKLLEAHYQEK
jgi:hypothetical protein